MIKEKAHDKVMGEKKKKGARDERESNEGMGEMGQTKRPITFLPAHFKIWAAEEGVDPTAETSKPDQWEKPSCTMMPPHYTIYMMQ